MTFFHVVFQSNHVAFSPTCALYLQGPRLVEDNRRFCGGLELRSETTLEFELIWKSRVTRFIGCFWQVIKWLESNRLKLWFQDRKKSGHLPKSGIHRCYDESLKNYLETLILCFYLIRGLSRTRSESWFLSVESTTFAPLILVLKMERRKTFSEAIFEKALIISFWIILHKDLQKAAILTDNLCSFLLKI